MCIRAWVLPRHSHHQGDRAVVDRWPAGPVRVGPSLLDEAAMPTQDRVRSGQTMAAQCSGDPPREGGEHGPVRPVQTRQWVSAAQDSDLVAQHAELDVLGGGHATHDRISPSTCEKIKCSNRSDTRGSCPTSDRRWQRPRPDFWHPTGSDRARLSAQVVNFRAAPCSVSCAVDTPRTPRRHSDHRATPLTTASTPIRLCTSHRLAHPR